MVNGVLWLGSFVPSHQDAKLPLIQDAAGLLAITLAPPRHVPPVDAPALREAVHSLAAKLGPILPRLPADHPLRQIAADLIQLESAPDAALIASNRNVVRFLPMQLDRLRLALTASLVTQADIPSSIRADWVAADGRLRLQVTPRASVRGSAALRGFLSQVQAVAPNVTGSTSTIVASADTVVSAFRIAATSAVVAITLILAVVLRRVLDVALVLAPLLLSALLTVVVASMFRLQLNFANIIVLPLLLGVGVSFNIYFVMNWRAGLTKPLGSATARAVAFSALTTGTAFGSLALSNHPGTASMGTLLLISLGCTVCTTLLFLPALLGMLPRVQIRA